MASKDPINIKKPEKHGVLYFIQKLFSRHKKAEEEHERIIDDYHREPKYWPEVIDFIDNINHLIESHTISDTNVQHINQRIVDYMIDQINTKGSVQDIEERYFALNTLADRILSNTLNKIVGLKHMPSTHADFTEAVGNFKKRLAIRHKNEIDYYKGHSQGQPPVSH